MVMVEWRCGWLRLATNSADYSDGGTVLILGSFVFNALP